MTTRRHPIAAARPPAPDNAATEYARHAAEIDSVPDDQLVALNVDIPSAVSVILAAHERMRPYRAALDALPNHAAMRANELRSLALAAWYAHVMDLPKPQVDQQQLIAECGPLREDMLHDAENLARKKLLDRDAIAAIRAGTGLRDAAGDLIALAAQYRANWDRVENKTTVTLPEVARAEQLGPELLASVGQSENQPAPTKTETGKRRHRAWSIVANAYSECQRSVAWLRWHEDDAAAIAPALTGARAAHRAQQPQPDGSGAAPAPT